MKIYLATSWRNESIVKDLAHLLRMDGYEVDCFCDESTGRYVFRLPEKERLDFDAINFLEDSRAQKAFKQDKDMIDWADIVIMLLPCGSSAHLEAGYAKGSGKKLFIFGEFPKGFWEVMYGFADKLYRGDKEGLSDLREELKRFEFERLMEQ